MGDVVDPDDEIVYARALEEPIDDLRASHGVGINLVAIADGLARALKIC